MDQHMITGALETRAIDFAETGLRQLLDENPVIGIRKSGPKRHWTTREISLLHETYPTGSVAACLPLLPGRTATAIYQRACIEKLDTPRTLRAGKPRQRYATSEHIDASIKRRYPIATNRGDVLRLAKDLNRPREWLSKRALALGLVQPRFKEPAWTEAEFDLVRTVAHFGLPAIKRKLKKDLGSIRTETAIKVKLKRIDADCTDPNHYTATGLATLLGLDPKTVSIWCVKGELRADRRGTERTQQQGGDQWWIHRKSIRAFIIGNPVSIDIRKVDKFWFIDLLAGRHED